MRRPFIDKLDLTERFLISAFCGQKSMLAAATPCVKKQHPATWICAVAHHTQAQRLQSPNLAAARAFALAASSSRSFGGAVVSRELNKRRAVAET
jgi:hypothetical protein